MKIFIILSVLGLSQALVDPSILFDDAQAHQLLVTALQQDIVSKITSLRTTMSGILKRTSNTTLTHIQDNLQEIFEMENSTRKVLFDENPTMEPCILNLRTQLNSVTEHSGYESGVCILRFDRSVTALVARTYETLTEYEDLISQIQTLVLTAFSDRNIWTKSQIIADDFAARYQEENAKWIAIQGEISSLLATVESDIQAQNVVLRGCFDGVQERLVPQYARLEAQAEVCREFNS